MSRFDHFNVISPIYDFVFGKNTNLRILQFVDLEKQHSLLDIGGGTGRISQHFLNQAKQVIIADSAKKMLGEAHRKGITGVNANSEALPFQNDVFDWIIMVDAFHHVGDQQRTIEEMWRSLAPGGRLIIEEPDIRHWVVKLIALGEKLLLMRSHFRKPDEIINMMDFDDTDSIDLSTDMGIAWIRIKKKSIQK